MAYDGKQVVKPENLTERDSRELVFSIELDDEEVINVNQERFRDILKMCCIKDGTDVSYMLIGIEHQSNINNYMVIRNMLYDALNYARQIKNKQIVPVITLVVYLGNKDWTGPRSLYEMLGISENNDVTRKLDKRYLKLIQNYRLNILVPKEMVRNKETNKLHTDMEKVVDLIGASGNRKLIEELLKEKYDSVITINNNTLGVLNTCGIVIPLKEQEGDNVEVNLCEAWKEMIEQERSEGASTGRLEGLLEGKFDSVEKIISKFGISIEEACNTIGCSVDEYNEFKGLA
jgi:hypothetical protein